MAHDREAEAEPGLGARGRRVSLTEAVEDVRDELGVHAFAGVGDVDLDVRVDAGERQVDAPAFGRELHRVGEQVPHHLL